MSSSNMSVLDDHDKIGVKNYKDTGYHSEINYTSFYTKFANFFPFNVLYKKFEVFEIKNHENCQNNKK